MYCILGFCSIMNVYKIINSLGARICPTSFNHVRVPKSHSIHVQNPTKSLFSNKDLVWTSGIVHVHGGPNKVTIQFAYVPYVHISEFLEGEQAPLWNGMFTKKFQAKQMSSNQLSKTTSGIHGKHVWH
jgi:hypothetical protein